MNRVVVGIIAVFIVVGVIYIAYQVIEEERNIKEVEVCEGITIATINAGEGLCSAGCIQYKGEFVPYQTLKYLQEFCEEKDVQDMTGEQNE